MKALKYAGLALAGLVLLVVAGVVVFAMTFDPNKYKGQIAAAVKEKTGRILKLEGDLKVAIFPSLGADVARFGLLVPLRWVIGLYRPLSGRATLGFGGEATCSTSMG